MLLSGFSCKTSVWTGWSDVNEEGTFVNQDYNRITLNWSNWGRNQPDGGADFYFHDDACDAKHVPLCNVNHVFPPPNAG